MPALVLHVGLSNLGRRGRARGTRANVAPRGLDPPTHGHVLARATRHLGFALLQQTPRYRRCVRLLPLSLSLSLSLSVLPGAIHYLTVECDLGRVIQFGRGSRPLSS